MFGVWPAILLAALAVACVPEASPSPTTATPTTGIPAQSKDGELIPVIVDYSPTVSDVGGLMYLLSDPGVEVIAISLPPTGEAGCDLGFDVTVRVLAMFGKEDIPVACDENIPVGAHPWPDDFLPGTNLLFGLPTSTAEPAAMAAPGLIAAVAKESPRPVVVWAVGPLTNLARAIDEHSSLAEDIGRIVIMGGAVDVPGNVDGRNAEWNIWVDVDAASTVIGSGIPVTLVPLDATNHVPVPVWYERVLEHATQSQPITYLRRQVAITPAVTRGFFYLWDELAAAVISGSELVTTEVVAISVVEDGPDEGRTMRHDEGQTITVATGVVDPNEFYRRFLGLLAGRPVEVGRDPTSSETTYGRAVEEEFAPLWPILEALFSSPTLEGDYDPEAMVGALTPFLDALEEVHVGMSTIEPPHSLAPLHQEYIDALARVVGRRVQILSLAAAAESFQELSGAGGFEGVGAAREPLLVEAAWVGLEIEILC